MSSEAKSWAGDVLSLSDALTSSPLPLIGTCLLEESRAISFCPHPVSRADCPGLTTQALVPGPSSCGTGKVQEGHGVGGMDPLGQEEDRQEEVERGQKPPKCLKSRSKQEKRDDHLCFSFQEENAESSCKMSVY